MGTLYNSDGDFAFIAGYTEGGLPFGIRQEEWNELESFENDVCNDSAVICIPKESAEILINSNMAQTIEKSVHVSIALSLFLTHSISIQKAATIANCPVNDFILFMQHNRG